MDVIPGAEAVSAELELEPEGELLLDDPLELQAATTIARAAIPAAAR